MNQNDLTVNYATVAAIAALSFSTIAIFSGCDTGGPHSGITGGKASTIAGQNAAANGAKCVSFGEVKKLVFETKCKTCHGDGSPMKNWLDYATAAASKNNILDKVTNTPPKMGGAPMPMGATLEKEQIDALNAWVLAGAPETCATSVASPQPTGAAPPQTPPSATTTAATSPGAVSTAASVATTTSTAPATPAAPSVDGAKVAATCIGCHGAEGVSAVDTFPSLAGQSQAYLQKQLNAFKTGQRKNDVMNGQMASLNAAELAAVAEFFAKKKAFGAGLQVRTIDRDKERDLAVCLSCHNPGVATDHSNPLPVLLGQKKDYMISQVKAFRALGRKDIHMREKTEDLTDDQITKAATYFSTGK